MANDGSVKIGVDVDENGFKSSLSKLGSVAKSSLVGVTAALGAASAGVVAFGKSAIDAGMSFDSSMSQVAATMGKTTDEIQDLRDFAMEMGAKTAFSATEAADALNYMALAGYDSQEAMQQLPNVLNLAAAGSIDLAYASDMVTDAQSALGLSMEESAELVDKMAMASSKSNTSVAQLGEAILTVGGTAKNLAGGTTELSTALGILADNGVKGAEGGTALRNIILSLSAPTDKAAESMESLGLSVFDSKGNMRSLNDIFGDLNSTLSKMTQGEQIQVLNTIFNKVDLKSVNALLANTGDRFKELSGYIDNANDSAEKMAETQLDNLAGDITLFKSALEGAQIVLSDQLTPTLRNFVQFGSTSISSLSDAFQTGGFSGAMDAFGDVLSEALAMIVDIIPEITSAGAQLLSALLTGIMDNAPQLLASIPEIVNSLISAFQSSGPELLSSGAELLNMIAQGILTGLPILAQSAVTLMGNLGQYLQSNLPTLIATGLQFVTSLSESIRENAGLLVDGALSLIMSLANGLIASLPTLIEYIPQIITNIAGIINDNAPKLIVTAAVLIKNLAVGLVKAIPTLVANIPQIIQAIIAVFTAYNWLNLGKTIITKLKDGIVAMVGSVKASAQTILQNINGTLSALPGNLLALGRSGITGLINGLKSLIGNIAGTMVNVSSAILNSIKSIPSQLLSLGKNIIQGLINGIKSGIAGLLSVVGDIGKSVYDKIAGFFDIHSPSRLMLWVGQMIMTGLGNGMKTKLDYVQGVAEDVSSLIEKEIADTQDKIAQIEKEAQEKQAADELAEHKKQIAEKYAELEKAEISERENIRKEIASLEQEWADKQAEAAKEAEKEALNAKLEALEDFRDEYESRLQEIQDLESDMVSKLADYGDLFAKTKEDSKELFELGDLQAQIDAIDEYSSKLEEIRSRGVTVGLMDEILGMSVEDATDYMDALLAKTPEQLDEYIALFEEKQEKAREVARNFWQTDYAELEAEFAEGIPESVSGLTGEMYDLGTESGTAISDGIQAQKQAVEDSLVGVVSSAISTASSMLNAFISSVSGNINSIQGRMSAAVASATPAAVPMTVSNTGASVERSIRALGKLLTYTGDNSYTTKSAQPTEVVFNLNGTEVARALVPDIRKVEDQSPRIVSD